MAPDDCPTLDTALRTKLAKLSDEGRETWTRFDREVRSRRWHPFMPADYEKVLQALIALRRPGLRFLEWGSATGVVAIMADLLGYEAYGIELDEDLVAISLEMARQYGSGARFVAGSLLPTGYTWRPHDGDGRLGTVGEGASGYPRLGLSLDDFDVVYAYPWGGEEAMMHDLMRARGARDADLLLQKSSGDVESFRNGKPRGWPG